MDLNDKVIKLRCVKVTKVGDKYNINLTNLSSCLMIREWFYDARHLRKSLGLEKTSKKAGEPDKNYHSVKTNFISTIKSSYDIKKSISVKDLTKKLEQSD